MKAMYWKDRLFEARERCEGLHEDVYLIADYMFAIISSNALSPQGLALCFSEAMNIMRTEVPRKVQAVYFPQLIDELADEDYAEEFRKLCKEAYGFNPPKRYTEVDIGEIPEYIKVAVDWWANAITSRGCNEHVPRKLYQYVANGQHYTREEIATYKKALSQRINRGLKSHTDVKLYVDNWACPELEDAGRTIGVDPMIGYPWNTYMLVTEKEVRVLDEFHEGIWETLWQQK